MKYTRNDIVRVTLYCSNPSGPFTISCDSLEDAQPDIEERSRWYELRKIGYTMPNGKTYDKYEGEFI
jgi:hypothetical protein